MLVGSIDVILAQEVSRQKSEVGRPKEEARSKEPEVGIRPDDDRIRGQERRSGATNRNTRNSDFRLQRLLPSGF